MTAERLLQAIPFYTGAQQIFESNSCKVFRAWKQQDNEPVLIKCYKQSDALNWQKNVFHHEYELTHKLSIPNVVQAKQLIEQNDCLALIMEDVKECVFLQTLLAEQPLDFKVTLDLMQQLAVILQHLHANKIVHRDIRPANILVDISSWQLHLTGFSIASTHLQIKPTLNSFLPILGDLAYISPEQTGQINNEIDYRCDFYSLGVLLYQLLTGQLPYSRNQRLAQTNEHLLLKPVPVHELCPDIPESVSAIVNKLIQKQPEDRYQSAAGLKKDLQTCVKQWRETGTVIEFQIARTDAFDQFLIPAKLFGREHEISVLEQSFNKIIKGGIELVILSGKAGIGKSTLAREAFKSIAAQSGLFMTSSFTETEFKAPYSAWIKAFRNHLLNLISQGEAEIEYWRDSLVNELGEDVYLLTTLIPEIEKIITSTQLIPQKPSLELSKTDFTILMVKFIRAFCRSRYPVTIFLNNVQWADEASIELMTFLASSVNCCPGCQHLLIICASKDDLVGDIQPLHSMLNNAAVSSVHIKVKALEVEAINDWFEKIFHVSGSATLTLAELLYKKTQGNPLLIKEIVISLQQQNMFVFDPISGGWQWNSEQVNAACHKYDISTIFFQSFQRLDQQTQQLIQLAACIGHCFDLQSLIEHSEHTFEQVQTALNNMIEQGFIIQIDTPNTVMKSVDSSSYQTQQIYCFNHDLIHQSVYQSINQRERISYHKKIGLHLLELFDNPTNKQLIFDCVNQLNRAVSSFTNQKQRVHLATLNLQAGLLAKSIRAFSSALVFFNQGMAVLQDDDWFNHYILMLQLATLSAKSAFHNNDYDLVNTRYMQISQNVVDILDKSDVQIIKLNALTAQHDFSSAIDLMIACVAEMGIHIPVQPEKKSLWLNKIKINQLLNKQKLIDLSPTQFIDQPRLFAGMALLCYSLKASFHSMPELFTYTLQKLILMTLEYGNNPLVATALIGYGGICCEQFDELEEGLEIAAVGIKLIDDFEVAENEVIAELMSCCFIAPWQQPLPDCLDNIEQVFERALSLRDFICAEWALLALENYMYFAGLELTTISAKIKSYDKQMINVDYQYSLTFNQILRQTIAVLTNRSTDACKRTTVQCQFLTQNKTVHAKRGDFQHFFLHFQKAVINYLFGFYDDAELSMKTAAQQQSSALLGAYSILLNFYDSLIRIASITDLSAQEKKQSMQQLIINQQKMKNWAKFTPHTCRHKYLLLKAEIADLENKQLQAGKYFEDAIEAVQETDNILETALVWELAASFEMRKGRKNTGKILLGKAYQSYSQWGGWAKVRQLNEAYPEQETSHSLDNPLFSSYHDKPESSYVDSLKNANKAIEVLSKAPDKQTLFELWIKQIREMYVAQRIVLMVKQSEKLSVVAESEEDGSTIYALHQSIESYTLPTSIVSLAISTGQQIIASSPSELNPYNQDPYFGEHQVESVICIPVVDNNQIGCVVYIENTLSQDSFSTFKIELCHLILSIGWNAFKNSQLADTLQTELTQIDIERKGFTTTEARLRESKSHIQSVLETSLDAVISINAKGMVIDWSAKAETIFGWNAKQTIGHLLADFIIPEEHREAHRKGMVRFLRTGQGKVVNQRIEITGMRSDGIKIPVELAIAPIFSDGKFIFSAFIRDLTEQKQIEAELNQQRDALYQSEKLSSLGTLLAGVSHELNNPLSVVVGRSMMLQSEVDDEKTIKTLGIIKNSAERCSKIVKSFLAIARQQEPNYALVQINDLLHEAIDLIAYGLAADGIECVFDLQIDLPLLSGDIDQLRQVFSNIIVNAHQALQQLDGSRQIHFRTYLIHDEIVVSISDNGTGVPEAIKNRIFEPFYTSKPVGKGTGFGLSYSRGVVESHAGKLQLESPLDGGARFVIQLPVDHFKIQSKVLGPEPAKKINKPFSLLIVDDEQEVAEMLGDRLKTEGHNIRIANNGLTALKICQNQVFELIICDLHMPKMDGLTFSKLLVQQYPAMENKVVFITGDSLGIGDSNDLKATGYKVIRKPVIPDEFAQTINDILIDVATTSKEIAH